MQKAIEHLVDVVNADWFNLTTEQRKNRGVPPPTAEWTVSRGDGKPLFTIYIITHNKFFSTKKEQVDGVKVL